MDPRRGRAAKAQVTVAKGRVTVVTPASGGRAKATAPGRATVAAVAGVVFREAREAGEDGMRGAVVASVRRSGRGKTILTTTRAAIR
jgi:hypothetical protein